MLRGPYGLGDRKSGTGLGRGEALGLESDVMIAAAEAALRCGAVFAEPQHRIYAVQCQGTAHRVIAGNSWY